VDWVQDGASALTAIGDGDIDLVVLDLGLPRMDGIDVIRKVRAAGGNVPILVLSARERASDRTLGLDVGADDYLGKPFDTPELLARVRALLRRSVGRTKPTLEAGALSLDPARLTAIWKGHTLDLTRREFALLRLLMEQQGRPLGRETIQQHLYGWDEDVASNAVDVHVHQLRRKLDPGIIRTVRGIGYALGDPSDATA
jgi:two-component system OmpR family response regulator/two-component system response regulator QseB